MPERAPIVRVDRLVRHFPGAEAGRVVRAVDDVSFEIAAGETLAMVGESGSGKSTIARLVLRLDTPTSGRVFFDGTDITAARADELRRLRAQMQMVFQDPWGSLNPRLAIGALIEEPLLLHTPMGRDERRAAAIELAGRVRLDRQLLERYPAQLSGGQLQRVAIARAIATRPKLIVLDEPTSSLDLSVRAEILNLLVALRRETQAALLFITHDLGTVRLISDRVVVLYLGAIVESGPTAQVFDSPQHRYTRTLLGAVLPTDPRRKPQRAS
jgi:ABC-type oligopeptide transport system ATPase subunit